MFDETLLFFKNNANGIMYLMFFFIAMLITFSYLNSPAGHIGGSGGSGHFFDTYGKNIIYSIVLITILLFLFSILGYNFNLSSSSSTSSTSSFKNTETYKFFSENGLTILNVVILFLMLIVAFSMAGIDFSHLNQPISNKSIRRVVEIESFACQTDNQIENEKQCNLLSAENCISTGCCGLLNGSKCVSSNVYNKGPNYYSDASGNAINVTSWCNNENCEPPVPPPTKKCRVYS
jgi:hypothetical protein